MIDYQEIWTKLEQGEKLAIQTVLQGEQGRLKEGMERILTEAAPEGTEKESECFRVRMTEEDGKITISEPVIPQERLLILGGGHIALHLCEFAAKCGFQVSVADDRAEFCSEERFPYAEKIFCCAYEKAVKDMKITSRDFVVVVTRGHKHDENCLREIFAGTYPAYLGMIGSRKRVRAQFELLQQEGYPREFLDRIFTPIGLKIGAVTPQEIAVSILAELIACKRMAEYRRGSREAQNVSDLEISVVKQLALNQAPAALVTVIEANGSVPRKAGAKMLVKQDGTIQGTIGGGCGEGAAIAAAREIIGTGKYQILKLDFTGDVAASEGMVCGGHQKVLIEDFQLMC